MIKYVYKHVDNYVALYIKRYELWLTDLDTKSQSKVRHYIISSFLDYLRDWWTNDGWMMVKQIFIVKLFALAERLMSLV